MSLSSCAVSIQRTARRRARQAFCGTLDRSYVVLLTEAEKVDPANSNRKAAHTLVHPPLRPTYMRAARQDSRFTTMDAFEVGRLLEAAELQRRAAAAASPQLYIAPPRWSMCAVEVSIYGDMSSAKVAASSTQHVVNNMSSSSCLCTGVVHLGLLTDVFNL